ncbi:MAG: lysostaphin resistance A-like protein [Promethearchaeota archaeon]
MSDDLIAGKNNNHDGNKEYWLLCPNCLENLEKFFVFGPLYCPFCGAPINEELFSGTDRRNFLTGKALWSLKWTILIPIICYGLLILITFIVEFFIIFGLIYEDIITVGQSNLDIEQLAENAIQLLTSPIIFSLFSTIQIIFIIVPIFSLKKFRPKIKDRFKLLGWRPYFKHLKLDQALKKSIKKKSQIPIDKRQEIIKHGFIKLGKDSLTALFYGMGMVGIEILLMYLITYLIKALQIDFQEDEFINQVTTPTNPGSLIILIATMILIVGPTEEFLFRGYLQQGLESSMTKNKALILSAFIFAIVHVAPMMFAGISNIIMMLPYFVISLLLCSLYSKLGNLNILILTHGIYNSLLIILEYFYYFNNLFQYQIITILFIIISFIVGSILVYLQLKYFVIPPIKNRKKMKNHIAKDGDLQEKKYKFK